VPLIEVFPPVLLRPPVLEAIEVFPLVLLRPPALEAIEVFPPALLRPPVLEAIEVLPPVLLRPPVPALPPAPLHGPGHVPKSGVQQILLLVIQSAKLELLVAISETLINCVSETPSLSKSFVVMTFKVKLGSVQA
jgi:hypothetical protein